MKVIRFLGTFGAGFILGGHFISVKNGNAFDWMTFLGGFPASLLMAFLPDILAKNQTLILNENGIFSKGQSSTSIYSQKITWDKIRSVKIKKGDWVINGYLDITNTIGSNERIPIPLHTKAQIQELHDYLSEIATSKNVTYSA